VGLLRLISGCVCIDLSLSDIIFFKLDRCSTKVLIFPQGKRNEGTYRKTKAGVGFYSIQG